MRATVSHRVDGLNVHPEPKLGGKVVDALEPGFAVDVIERNPHSAPDWCRISYERKLKGKTAKVYTGWCKTVFLVFDWEKPAQPELDIGDLSPLPLVIIGLGLILLIGMPALIWRMFG